MNHKELDYGDWRIQTVAHVGADSYIPWTNQWVEKGTRLTVIATVNLTKRKTLSIPVPNATAIMLNAAAAAYDQAKQLRLNSGIDKSLKSSVTFDTDRSAIDYVERMIEAILMAFTAIEAFANETIPNDYTYSHHRSSKTILEISDKQKIERNLSLDEKLSNVLPEVIGCRSPKGTRSWESYRQLKNVRDRIVHMKTADRKSSGPDLDTVWKVILLTPAPHLLTRQILEHFISAMEEKPRWFLQVGNTQ